MDTDVGIVGAGAAGGVLAFELARRGIRVVVLEAGARHEFARRAEYVRRYLQGENPWQTSPPEPDRSSTDGGPTAYRLEGKRARGLGGSTLHWEGYALRLHASDFRSRSLYGFGDDWPSPTPISRPTTGRPSACSAWRESRTIGLPRRARRPTRFRPFRSAMPMASSRKRAPPSAWRCSTCRRPATRSRTRGAPGAAPARHASCARRGRRPASI